MDSITLLRGVMAGVGIMLPLSWKEPWKCRAFRLYALFVDMYFMFFVLTKFLDVVTGSKLQRITVISYYECLMLFSITLERLLYRRKTNEVVYILKKIKEFKTTGGIDQNTVRNYTNSANRLSFGFGYIVLVIFLFKVVKWATNACWFSDSHSQENCQKLLVDIWVPFDYFQTSWYSIIFVLNLIQIVLSVGMIYISHSTIPLLCIHLCCQFKMLADDFEHLLDYSEGDRWLGFRSFRRKEEEIVELIEHHQVLLESVNHLARTLHVICLVKLVFISIPLISVSISLSQVPFGTFEYLQLVFLFSIMLTELFLLCYFGEQLINHSLLVYRAVYMSQWFNLPVPEQKLLLICAIRAGHPPKLEVWPHFVPICLETFINVCQFCYSTHSVLLVVSKRATGALYVNIPEIEEQ